METELYAGQQKILFDREATAALYRQTIMVPGADQCICIPCKNFAAQRGTAFPEEFRQFLSKLGADPLKEWEVFGYNFDPKNSRKVLYGGWFLFIGKPYRIFASVWNAYCVGYNHAQVWHSAPVQN